MLSKFIGSIIRTGAAVASGFLISKGLPADAVAAVVDPASAALAGIMLYAATQGWSLFEKYAKEEIKKRF